jgi:hypothetical protein
MTAASDGGAQRRKARAAGQQARQRRDPLLGPEASGPFRSRLRAERVAAGGVGCGQ